jgi:FtsH-binding integral membrane protein
MKNILITVVGFILTGVAIVFARTGMRGAIEAGHGQLAMSVAIGAVVLFSIYGFFSKKDEEETDKNEPQN